MADKPQSKKQCENELEKVELEQAEAAGAGSSCLIAVGLDGSKSSWRAFEEAISQAKSKKASLHLVSVLEHMEPSVNTLDVLDAESSAAEKLERIQLKARLQAESEGLEVVTAVLSGHSARDMVKYVKKEGISLLVLGDTGHSSLLGALLGNTADKIVRSAPCSVLIVR